MNLDLVLKAFSFLQVVLASEELIVKIKGGKKINNSTQIGQGGLEVSKRPLSPQIGEGKYEMTYELPHEIRVAVGLLLSECEGVSVLHESTSTQDPTQLIENFLNRDYQGNYIGGKIFKVCSIVEYQLSPPKGRKVSLKWAQQALEKQIRDDIGQLLARVEEEVLIPLKKIMGP